MAKRFLVLMIALLCIGLTAAPECRADRSATNKIRHGSPDKFPPFSFVNDKGEFDGFSAEMAKAVTEVMGLELEIKIMPIGELGSALTRGEVDFLMLAHTKERAELFEFSAPFITLFDAIFVRKGSPVMRTIEDLSGRSTIVVRGDVAHAYLLSHGISHPDSIVPVDTLADALRLLASGQGDAALLPKLVGTITVQTLKLTNLEVSPAVIDEYNRPFGFTAKKGNTELVDRLSQGLGIIKATGRYQQIYDKWLGAYEPRRGFLSSKAEKYTLGAVLSALLLITIWSVSLRRMVAVKTSALRHEITKREQSQMELKRKEEEYRLLLNSTAEAIYGLDLKGNCTFCNPSCIRMLGYESELDLLGNNMHRLMHHSHGDGTPHPDTDCLIHRSFISGEGGHSDTEVFWRKDGTQFPVEYWSYPIINEGDIVGSVVAFTDITERKLAEHNIMKSLMEKEVLLREVHHRVKNNMAIISSMLNLQANYVDNEKYLDMFRESQHRIKTMALVHEKLYQTGDFSSIDVSDYVSSLVRSIAASFSGKITIKSLLDIESVTLDLDALIPCGLIVNELLTNAYKYAFDGASDAEIKIRLVRLADGHISLSVSDNGVGLPDSFDINYPSGLGLKLVRGLVNQLEGTLDVKSGPGGAVFTVTFPDRAEPAV